MQVFVQYAYFHSENFEMLKTIFNDVHDSFTINPYIRDYEAINKRSFLAEFQRWTDLTISDY